MARQGLTTVAHRVSVQWTLLLVWRPTRDPSRVETHPQVTLKTRISFQRLGTGGGFLSNFGFTIPTL